MPRTARAKASMNAANALSPHARSVRPAQAVNRARESSPCLGTCSAAATGSRCELLRRGVVGVVGGVGGVGGVFDSAPRRTR
eukprot:1886272-Pleurochrysis_carterae.AAC.1